MQKYKFDFKKRDIVPATGTPCIMYSRSTHTEYYMLDSARASFNGYLSNLSQVLHDHDSGVWAWRSTSPISIGVALIISVLEDDDETVGTSLAFGNVFNYTLQHCSSANGRRIYSLIESNQPTVPMYTRSTGEEVIIAKMQDVHLYRAFRRQYLTHQTDNPFWEINEYKNVSGQLALVANLCKPESDDAQLNHLYNEIVTRAKSG